MTGSTLAFASAMAAIVSIPCASVFIEAASDAAHAMALRPEARFALIMEYRSDAYALDTGMSLSDCMAALPSDQADKGLTFACELEPKQ